MIVQLRGELIRKDANTLVLDVNGVGYGILATLNTVESLEIGQSVTLQVSQIFREDSVSLFGFLNTEQRDLFDLLCTVNGVGPKSALAILSRLGVQGVMNAVAAADDEMFRSVNGVGPKTAKLIVLSLSGKLLVDTPSDRSETDANVIQALINLGFQDRAVRQIVASIQSQDNPLSEPELLKSCLASLSNSRKIETND